MNTKELLDRIGRAVMLESDDAAIRIHAEYEPQGGPSAKVFPPTYKASGGTKYHFEQRYGQDGQLIDVVILDSIQSQANRAEAALEACADEIGLPLLVMEAEVGGRSVRISNLAAPHRSRDAYFLDSEHDGKPFDATEVGQALNSATPDDVSALLRYAPADLVYGVWDSHRGKRIPLKFARAYTSEMLGWAAKKGRRAATKGDPMNLARDEVPREEWRPGTTSGQGKKKDVRLSEIGHGMVPGQPDDEAGGVAVSAITRGAVLSLTGLARYRFGESDPRAQRVALAAIGLLADRLAFARAGLHLRSGSDLVRRVERIEWVRAGVEPEPLDLTVDNARALLSAAREQLSASGVVWDPQPFLVQPSDRLRRAIERTFQATELEAED